MVLYGPPVVRGCLCSAIDFVEYASIILVYAEVWETPGRGTDLRYCPIIIQGSSS